MLIFDPPVLDLKTRLSVPFSLFLNDSRFVSVFTYYFQFLNFFYLECDGGPGGLRGLEPHYISIFDKLFKHFDGGLCGFLSRTNSLSRSEVLASYKF